MTLKSFLFALTVFKVSLAKNPGVPDNSCFGLLVASCSDLKSAECISGEQYELSSSNSGGAMCVPTLFSCIPGDACSVASCSGTKLASCSDQSSDRCEDYYQDKAHGETNTEGRGLPQVGAQCGAGTGDVQCIPYSACLL